MGRSTPQRRDQTTAADRVRIGYQPALDGVRAVAVAVVLLFHGQVPGMSGGYLGVSVFFTLSGFLITSLLVHEVDRTGRVAVGDFYARRARRLLPASVVCVALVVVVAAATDVFDGVTELRRQAIGSLLQVANWVFLFGEGSYQELFEASVGAVSPLEHYWSLAIEEQFYWVWPIAFVGLVRVAPSRRSQIRWLAGITIVAAASAPLIAAVWGGDAAYWATPARAAEILVGALLAVVLAGRRVDPRLGVLAPVALAVLAVAFVTFPAAGGPAYAGALPLVGVVSAALLLGLQAPGRARAALAVGPLVWLGRISYGVYLYHWPVFVIADQGRTGLDGPALFAVRIALTLAIAQVSFVLLEQPIRHGRARRGASPGESSGASSGSGRRTFAAAAAATTVAVVGTVALVPGANSDYWTVSAADAEAAAIRPSDEPLAPLVASGGPTSTSATGSTPESTPESTPPDASATPTATSAPSRPRDSATVPPVSGPSADSGASDTGTSDSGASDSGTSDTAASSTTSTAAPTSTTIVPIPELSRPVRVVVAGDSTAEASGFGLVGWAADNAALAQVQLEAAPGCGFVRGGDVLVEEWRPVPARCDQWLDADLPTAIASLQPDVVMLKTTSWDVLDHRWVAGEQLSPVDPAFRDRIVADLAAVTDRALAEGAETVVWVLQPIPNPLWMSAGQTQEDPARHQVLYDAMRLIADDRPGRVEVVDLAGWLAARGHDVDVEMRPDGVHWSPEASRSIADEYLGEQLVRAALGLPRP